MNLDTMVYQNRSMRRCFALNYRICLWKSSSALSQEFQRMSSNFLSDLTSTEIDPLIWFENNRIKLQNLTIKLKSRKTQENSLRLGKILEDLLSVPPQSLRTFESKIVKIKDKLLELKKSTAKETASSSQSSSSENIASTEAQTYQAAEVKNKSNLTDHFYEILSAMDNMLRTGDINRSQLKGKFLILCKLLVDLKLILSYTCRFTSKFNIYSSV